MKEQRMDQQFAFIREIDREKMIGRQTYITDGQRKENDAEHAWHMAVMALLLQEYANEEIDLLRTVSMILVHDLVEIYAGDTYAYDEEGKKHQKEREAESAERLYRMLPEDQKEQLYGLWREFEEQQTPESRFAKTMDNIQPLVLNDATQGRSWREHGVRLDQILHRNRNTAKGSEVLWEYARQELIEPGVRNGAIRVEGDTAGERDE